jgi:predicted RND superfamily exporter protein
MSWLDIKINMATVILGAISVGVVVDDTIHMFYRIQRLRGFGLNWKEAVENSLDTIGTSIYRTSVVLIVAFSCMATSDFLPTADFGIFISVSVAVALFLALFVAPYLLSHLGERRAFNEAQPVVEEAS